MEHKGFEDDWVTEKACSYGDAAITSFFPAKPWAVMGMGAIFTDDDEMAVYLRSVQAHGKGS